MSKAACLAFFDAWNRRDFDAAMEHVAEDCHYGDFSFVRPHIGRAEVRALYENVARAWPDLTFVITDVADGGSNVGTYWEVFVKGIPTGRTGVSFYKFDGQDKLIWALDSADPGPKHRTHDFH